MLIVESTLSSCPVQKMADASAYSAVFVALLPAAIHPVVLVYLVTALVVAGNLWWWRERRQRAQRRVLRGIIRLSENLLDAPSPREILARLQKQTPALLGATHIDLYLFETADDVLRSVSTGDTEAVCTPVSTPIGDFAGAVALCFRNRALLRIPDTRNSPILRARVPNQPSGAVFVPMFAQGDPIGVVAVYLSRRVLLANPDQDVALQHLGNQIAASLKLQEQQTIRDQLIRTEKMAAAGQLISAVANDLRGPLEAIGNTARLLSQDVPMEKQLCSVAREAERGLEMIDHLLSFARMEQRQATPLDIHGLTSRLLELRSDETVRKGIQLDNSLPVEPVVVLADQSQLEQALLTVIVNAEHAAASSARRTLRATSRIIGRKVLISFDVSRPAVNAGPPVLQEGSGFPVAKVIVQSHGGDLRHLADGHHGTRFDLELPVHDPVTAPVEIARHPERSGRKLTCLLVEPDTPSQRRLLSALAERGHRAIPATNAEQAADLVQRMHFDAVFCSSILPGQNWLELYRRIRRRVGCFALVADAPDSEVARMFESGEGRLLVRPVGAHELNDFLAIAEARYGPGSA